MIDYNELKSMIETGYDIEFSYIRKRLFNNKTRLYFVL